MTAPTQLLFGTAGIPHTAKGTGTVAGIRAVKELGLDAMELEFVRQINVKKGETAAVKAAAEKNNVLLTCHGQYFVNLNATNPAILKASVQRILDACRSAAACGVWSICYHMAYTMKMEKEAVYQNVKKQVQHILAVLRDEGNAIWLRPETGGKLVQFGELDELIRLSQDCEQVLPCIDWAHHHSRTNGRFNSYDDYAALLATIEKELGREAIKQMHCHCEGIVYNEKGERYHINLQDSDFNYKDLVRSWKDFKIKGVIISESPNIEADALMMKGMYERV